MAAAGKCNQLVIYAGALRRTLLLVVLAASFPAAAASDASASREALPPDDASASAVADRDDPAVKPSEPVVLLHGLARSGRSMRKLADALEKNGYQPCVIDYPSTRHSLQVLAAEHVLPAIRDCVPDGQPAHFVTHSMGGIIVRYLGEHVPDLNIGRVVMLGPPNQGSEVVDRIGDWRLFASINGPAGGQLGTDAASMPRRLGEAAFELGIIAGNRSINWINSTMIDGPDDGKVSVASAQLDGMNDFRVMPVTHPMMMRNAKVIGEVLAFLRNGRFTP